MKLIINIFLIFGLLLCAKLCDAQNLSLHSSPNGIFVSVDGITPDMVASMQIEKQALDNGDFKTVYKPKLPRNKKDLANKLEDAISLLSFNKTILDPEQIWDLVRSKDTHPNHYLLNLPPVKLAIGTGWLDQSVEENEIYTYRLTSKKEETVLKQETIKYTTSIAFPELFLYQASENIQHPSITWFALESASIRDFEIFRTPFGKIEYEEINTSRQTGFRADTIWMSMIDTTVLSEGVYLYYILPKDLYGNIGQSNFAVQVSNLTKQTLPIFTKLEATGHLDKKSIIINWEISRKERTRSLHLFRSREYDGEYQLVAELAPDDSIYIDPVTVANENFFYYLKINDIFGESRNSSRFFGLFKGNISPLAPKILKAEQIQEGVQISWRGIGFSIRGYYVMRAEGFKGEMKQISSFVPADTLDMSYIDSSATLKGQEVYAYAIVAESDTYDKSSHSDTLFVRPGVATVITPPLELNAFVRTGSVRLIWNDHSKQEAYLAGYNVWRKQKGEDEFSLLTESMLPNTRNMYIDSSIVLEDKYGYAITSVDFFGAESYMSRSKTIDLSGQLYKKPEDFWAQRADRGVMLKWVIAGDKHLKGFNLYKSNNQNKIVLWKTFSSSTREFLDTNEIEGQSSFYQISAVYSSDLESERTRSIFVKF